MTGDFPAPVLQVDGGWHQGAGLSAGASHCPPPLNPGFINLKLYANRNLVKSFTEQVWQDPAVADPVKKSD